MERVKLKSDNSNKVLVLTANYMVFRKCALPYLQFYYPHLDASDISVIVLGRPEKFVWELTRCNILGFSDSFISLLKIFKKAKSCNFQLTVLPNINLSRPVYILLLALTNLINRKKAKIVVIDIIYDKRYIQAGSLASILKYYLGSLRHFRLFLLDEFKYLSRKVVSFFTGLYLYSVFRFFSNKPAGVSTGICLVYKSKLGLGDFIVSTVFLYNLRLKYPREKLSALVFAEFEGIAKCIPFVDEWGFIRKPFSGGIGANPVLRNRFEEVYILDEKKYKLPIFERSMRGNKKFYLSKLMDPRKLKQMQGAIPITAVSIYKHLLKECGVPLSAQLPKLNAPEASKEKIKLFLAEAGIYDDELVVVITPGTLEHKRWSPERFAAVADHLAENFCAKIVIAEVMAEYDTYPDREVSRLMKNKHLNLAGLLSADLYVALIQRSALLIVNDTSASQVAASLGKDCVVIYGSTHPLFMGHRIPSYAAIKPAVSCAPCNLNHCLFDKRLCFDSISVKMVVDEASVFLTETLNKSKYEASKS